MRIISIVASQPKKWHLGSYIIMKELKTDYSHVSFIFWDKQGARPFFYECVLRGGVVFTGEKFWYERNKIMFQKDFMIEELDFDLFLAEAMDKCGEKYGFWQNIGIKLSQIFGLTRNFFSKYSSDKSNCSELIFSFKNYLGLKIDKNENLITPRDIVEAAKSL